MRRLTALVIAVVMCAVPATVQASALTKDAKRLGESWGMEFGGKEGHPTIAEDAAALTDAGSGGAGGELASIRACESGGDYGIDTGNGFLGAYQFMQSTWDSAAPAAGYGEYAGTPVNQVPPGVQDAVAQSHIDNGNRGAWPSC